MKTKARSGVALALLTMVGGCHGCTDFPDREYIECDGNETQCEGNAVEACEDGRWAEAVACAEGTTCVDGACACSSGDRRCQANTPEHCIDGQWQVQPACTSVLPFCEAGECLQVLMPLPETSGYGHTCVLGSAGGVYCWGANGKAQLGVVEADGKLPVRVPGLPGDVVDVALGWQHTCALTSGGDVWCWGSNGSGQLGPIGGVASDNPPTKVPDIPKAKLVRAAHLRTCVVDIENDVWCFGDNNAGEIALPAGGTVQDPTLVPALAGAEDLAMGTDITCSVRADGTSICTGDEQSPPQIPLDDIVELRANDFHQCAIREGELAACWGGNSKGQLGNGEAQLLVETPYTLRILGVDDVAVGWQHTCVLADGVVSCVGHAAQGQLGNGTTAGATYELTHASLPSAAFDITSSFGTVCAVTGPRDLYCWGENENDGGVGDGTALNQPTPVRIDWDAPDAN